MAYTNFTNCTKEQYESIIYSEEDTNRIRIWFNNVELLDADEYCESFSGTNRILPDDGNKIFTLDNFVAKNYTLILRDLPEGTIISDQVKVSIGTLVNENNNTYEDVPIGIFNIQDTPINDKGRVTIKLRDNRVKFDFNYNAQPLIESLGGTATKKQILEDICNQAGVTNNVSTFDGEDDEIGIYDNTITATTYVSYIFEQAGLMPFINREGQLDKINLNDLKVWRIPLSIVEKYEKGTPFKIERVVYESGIIKYESSNDESLDTLYLNSANPYINDKQQIDNIYNLLVGFSADSVKSGRILGNPAIDPFDMILIYDDEINNNPISTSTGTNLTLENTPNASTNIDLLGNTTQNGTPTPDNPVSIETTTGRNTIEVCGKNLLDMQNGTYVGAGITAIVNNGVITLNGTASGTSFINVPLKNIISINGSFTISANNNFTLGTISNWAGIRLGNIDYDTIGGQSVFSRTNTSETFNVENKVAYYLTIRTASGLSYNNNVIYSQVEKGSTATTYEPYIGNSYEVNLGDIELCKIGTYQDRLFKNTTGSEYYNSSLVENAWYKYNAIGKVVLNGSESWYYGGVASIFYTTSITDYAINNNIPYSNYYKGVSNVTGTSNMGTQNNNTIGFINQSGTTTPRLYIKDTTYTGTSANAIKTWLSNHNTIVYYVLATPTYTKIENDELIGQLNRLKTIQTIEGTTNIQQNNSSEPFELNVEYFNESYILKTIANNAYKYTGINRNEFNTEISLEQRKENVSIKSEATYQKLAKTEIDSANASINMITEELGFVDGNSQVIESIKTTQTQNSLDIEAITSYEEIDGKQVLTGVKTGKGFTFNNSGLIIRDANEENTYKTRIDETGTFYYDGDTPLGETTNEGSKFKNMDLYGEFHYGMDKITDTPLFVSMKFNDGSEECFGHFWNSD